MFEGWGRLVYRRRWPVLAAGLVAFALSIGILTQGLRPPSGPDIESEAQRASDLIQDELPRPATTGSSFVLVFSSSDLAASDARFREAMLAALEPLRADPRVSEIRTPYDVSPPPAALVSRDGERALAVVMLKDNTGTATSYYPALRARVASDTLTVTATGGVAINEAFERTLAADLQRAEYVAIPVALALLLLVFGSVVAALLPLGVGILAMIGGLAGVVVLSRVTDVSQYASNLVTLIGLGVAIDYSLFIVQRFRDELANGRDVEEAIARSLATAGRAIAFSGATVAIGLSAMLFYGRGFASVGIAGAIVVVIAVLYAVTVLPALLGVLGPRVNTWHLPLARGVGRGFWHSLAQAVMARPLLVLLPTGALILAAGTPFLHLRLADTDITALPPQDESRRGWEILRSEFRGQNESRITVVAHFPDGRPLTEERVGALYDLSRRIATLPDVLRVEGPLDVDPRLSRSDYVALFARPREALPPAIQQALRQSVAEHIVVLSALTSRPSTSDEARAIARSVRSFVPPPGGELLVTGRTAFDMDTIAFIARQTPGAVAYVTLTTILVLFLLLGSVLLPLKAVVMNLLSISASFGAIVWVFQDGHLAGPLNFTPQSLDPILPIILFCIVFGLSMDYEVLLLSRMQEEYGRSRDNRGAVAEGLERSGRLITGAAAIMVGVFAAFALADVVIVKSVGLGLAIAVALDATIVRALVVPATMRLLGDLNWWAPRPLARLYRRLAVVEA